MAKEKAKRKVRKHATWVTHAFLAKMLRDRIVKGIYEPTTQLPTRDDLEKQFKASRITIQRAFDILISEGFAIPRGRLGTFVTSIPPHLYHHRLILPGPAWSPCREPDLVRSMRRETNTSTRQGPNRILHFSGIHHPEDIETYNAIVEDVHVQRLAGLIIVGDWDHLKGSELLTKPNFPRVVIEAPSLDKNCPVLTLDRGDFYQKAFAFLQAKGRRKVALIGSSANWPDELGHFTQQIMTSRMVTENHWVHNVFFTGEDEVKNIITLMLHPDNPMRPDAIICTDHQMVKPLTDAMKDCELSNDALDCVVQTFSPTRTKRPAPVTALAYNPRDIIGTALNLIGAMRQKKTIRMHKEFKAEFESRVAAELVSKALFEK